MTTFADHDAAWKHLTAHHEQATVLAGVSGLLHWDQQVNMPPAAAASRSAQIAQLASLLHERMTDATYGEALAALADTDDDFRQAAVAHQQREYDRNTRLPASLVDQLARAQADGFEAWMAARKAKDFSLFAPALRNLLDLLKAKAKAIDPDRHPYDVLLDEFDLGTSIATLKPMFARLREGLTELVEATRDADPVPAIDVEVPIDVQKRLHERIIAALGYDLQAGRLDFAEHPFSIGLAQGDVRITTHLYDNDLLHGLSGTVHEAGHAMYEQGLPREAWSGTGLASAASYGLHESQSRFWENTIGASLPFFRWLQGLLADEGVSIDAEAMYRAANRIQPGLIRIAADEVTYNLHIIVRFELELALFDGTLDVDDLPAAWDDAMERLLGVRPPDHTVGVLQDVHWSGGAFAYFPSYTLGNLYAASLGAAMQAELPNLWKDVEQGEFASILDWLRDRVHQHGSRYLAPEIVRRAVGERDAVDDLLNSLWARHGALYGVTRG